jgi:hypothetical protein
MQKAGLILSTAWPSIVYLRSVRDPEFDVNRGNSQESREEDGRDDQPVISDVHRHIR